MNKKTTLTKSKFPLILVPGNSVQMPSFIAFICSPLTRSTAEMIKHKATSLYFCCFSVVKWTVGPEIRKLRL